MEENKTIQEQKEVSQTKEPAVIADNSLAETEKSVSQNQEGQVESTPSDLILGKFKSQDELIKAYQELEKHRGIQSEELGLLRQNATKLNLINEAWKTLDTRREEAKEIAKTIEKYNTPHYFQDPSFKEIYKEAFGLLGKNLDTDRLVNLLESYVASRIFAHDKDIAAEKETQQILNSMTFDKNSSSINPPKKRLDEMTPKEVDELLERLI